MSTLLGTGRIETGKIAEAANEIIANDYCEVIVVSMGAAGAVLLTKDEFYRVAPPAVKRKSVVGAGDSMVAGMVLSLSQKRSLKEALKYGVACGTAATLNAGTGLCRKEDVDKLLDLIKTSE